MRPLTLLVPPSLSCCLNRTLKKNLTFYTREAEASPLFVLPLRKPKKKSSLIDRRHQKKEGEDRPVTPVRTTIIKFFSFVTPKNLHTLKKLFLVEKTATTTTTTTTTQTLRTPFASEPRRNFFFFFSFFFFLRLLLPGIGGKIGARAKAEGGEGRGGRKRRRVRESAERSARFFGDDDDDGGRWARTTEREKYRTQNRTESDEDSE